VQGWGTEPGKPKAEGLRHGGGKQSGPTLSSSEPPRNSPVLPPLLDRTRGRRARLVPITEPILSQSPAARSFPAGRGHSTEEPALSDRPALGRSAAGRPARRWVLLPRATTSERKGGGKVSPIPLEWHLLRWHTLGTLSSSKSDRSLAAISPVF